ncbi:hypothetical protein D3C75_918950 [compost metagenome]
MARFFVFAEYPRPLRPHQHFMLPEGARCMPRPFADPAKLLAHPLFRLLPLYSAKCRIAVSQIQESVQRELFHKSGAGKRPDNRIRPLDIGQSFIVALIGEQQLHFVDIINGNTGIIFGQLQFTQHTLFIKRFVAERAAAAHFAQKIAVVLPDQLCGRQRFLIFGVLDHRDHPAALG